LRKTFLPFLFSILGSQNVCVKAQEEKRSEVKSRLKHGGTKSQKLGGVGVPVLGANQAHTHTVATIKKANTLFTS
jgi:hypothetical protein